MLGHVALALALLVGCPTERPAPPPPEPTRATPTATSWAEYERPLPVDGRASDKPVRVDNDSSSPVVLDTTFGPLSFARASRLDGAFGALWLDHPDLHCRCDCAPEVACPQCDAPPEASVTIPPGQAHRVPWAGALRQPSLGDEPCDTRFEPALDQYAVVACARDGRCAFTRSRLPSGDELQLRFVDEAVAPLACPVDDAVAERAIRIATRALRRGDPTLPPCGVRARRCLAEAELSAAAASGPACEHLVVPTARGLTVATVLRPPGGPPRVHSVELDPHGIRIHRVRRDRTSAPR